MKMFKVISKFYYNGKIETFLLIIAGNILPNEVIISRSKYDYYENYFASKKEAMIYVNACKSA